MISSYSRSSGPGYGPGLHLQRAKLLIPPFEKALSNLIDRGLYDKSLVVAMGEFGRTQRMNSVDGRVHWGHTISVLFGGGGIKMGQVTGA